MTEILRFLIIVLIIVGACRILAFVFKRCAMLRRIYSLKKECNAKITLHSFPFKPLSSRSENPDITVEILDTVYRIRLYPGGSGSKYVHFVDDEYSVVFRKIRAMVKPSRVATTAVSRVPIHYTAAAKVRVMRKMNPPTDNKRTIDVLLFSPSPYEVSYVTREKTTIKLAFTGDEMYGYRIFTPSSFAIFADREKRREESERRAARDPFSY